MQWFKKDNYEKYKRILLGMFPVHLTNEMAGVFEIIPFNQHQTRNYYNEEYRVENLIFDEGFDIYIEEEKRTIPYRLYFQEPEPNKEVKLNQIQKNIINCIYTRHHNGRIRQKRLEALKDQNEFWITPFRFQLIGDYVYEILESVSNQLSSEVIDDLKLFIHSNELFSNRTRDRMISYWDIYHRRQTPKINDYLGMQIFNRINQKHIGLNQEEILEIGIDKQECIYIKPKSKEFPLIWRSEKGVNWNNTKKVVHSTIPTEWSYCKWYLHIINTIHHEYNLELVPTRQTEYVNVKRKTKNQIQQNQKRPHNII